MNNLYNQPFGYMPQYMRNNVPMPMQSSYAPNNGITWVLGIENAKSQYVDPGKSAILMDSEEPKFYIKTVDMNGMGSIKAYTFKEVEPTTQPQVQPTAAPQVDMSQYVTKEELKEMLDKLTIPAANKSLI